jgi:drug/metabolite transporter (DMT)-like permease
MQSRAAGDRKNLLIVLAFIAIYIIWGSTYLLNKIVVAELDPFMLACVRFTVAGITMLILAVLFGKSIRITARQLKNTAFAGFLFLSLGNGFVVWALKFVDSGFAALEISAQPLVVLFMLYVIKGSKLSLNSIIGVVLGIAGMFLLVSQQQIVASENAWIGMIMIFFCMFAWSYASIFVGSADLPQNYLVNTGYQMICGGLFLFLLSLAFGERWPGPLSWSNEAIWAMLLLVVFGSIVAFTSFNFLLRTVSPEKVATSTYVNPIVALILGALILNEQITVQSAVAAVVLLTGVYFINSKKRNLILRRFQGRWKSARRSRRG